jgi:hypothetical protein
MTPAAFSKTWNETAAKIGCPARAQFSKRGMKAYEYRGQESKGHEVWWPISINQFEQIVAKYPAMNAVVA